MFGRPSRRRHTNGQMRVNVNYQTSFRGFDFRRMGRVCWSCDDLIATDSALDPPQIARLRLPAVCRADFSLSLSFSLSKHLRATPRTQRDSVPVDWVHPSRSFPMFFGQLEGGLEEVDDQARCCR
jgi:hypothetical protein